jgi:S1/P1 Nuclease
MWIQPLQSDVGAGMSQGWPLSCETYSGTLLKSRWPRGDRLKAIRDPARRCSVEDWATESLLAAREAYQDPRTGLRMKPGAKLADDYQAKSLPVAKRRLYQAGVRLAMVLNEVFQEK